MTRFAWRYGDQGVESDDPRTQGFEGVERFLCDLDRAQPGWLPFVDERKDLNDEVLRKCLGIDPDSLAYRDLDRRQRFELADWWFAGDERDIPYERWGLPRPPWILPSTDP